MLWLMEEPGLYQEDVQISVSLLSETLESASKAAVLSALEMMDGFLSSLGH